HGADAERAEVGGADRPPVERQLLGEQRHVEERRQPEEDVEEEGAEVLADHHLPLGDRRGEQHLERARAPLLGEQPHGEHRPDEEQRQPEEQRAAEEEVERRHHRQRLRVVEVVEDGLEGEAVEEEEAGGDHPPERREEVAAQLALHGGNDAPQGAASSASVAAGASTAAGVPVPLPASGATAAASCVVSRTKMSSSETFSSTSSSSTQPRSTARRKIGSRGSALPSPSSRKRPGVASSRAVAVMPGTAA